LDLAWFFWSASVFNLIVKGSGWSGSQDSFPLGRVFEYTEPDLVDRYKPNGSLDIAGLSDLPTVFVEETSGRGDQRVHVGKLIGVKVLRRELRLEYVYDALVPAWTNQRFMEFAAELGIEQFQFSRTHWSVIGEDLFRTLLRNVGPRRRQPEVFTLNDPERIEDGLVAVMMPFSSSFDGVYAGLKSAAQECGLRCLRADDIWESHTVIQDVVSLIDRASLLVCDCTGRNPNVFYEIGIAHALGKKVILITQSESDVPFDLRHLRFLRYLNNGEGISGLTQAVAARMRSLVEAT
jgi:hypothetical protein